MLITDLFEAEEIQPTKFSKGYRFFHGTTSKIAEIISTEGFRPPSYFTTSFDDAVYYAATGGEWDLQRREEEWENDFGYSPRDDYDPWEMFKMLYPDGAHPVVIEVEISEQYITASRSDSGAEGAIVVDQLLPPSVIRNVQSIDWKD